MMKKFLMSLLAVLFVFVSAETMAAPKSKKSSKKPVAKTTWKTDLKSAMAEAAKSKKQIFVLVTGSTWCPPCKNLEKSVLSKPEFLSMAAQSLVLVKADIPR
jgi:thiol:disulfide interchange protein